MLRVISSKVNSIKSRVCCSHTLPTMTTLSKTESKYFFQEKQNILVAVNLYKVSITDIIFWNVL